MTDNKKSFLKKHTVLPAIIIFLILLWISSLTSSKLLHKSNPKIGVLYINGVISDVTTPKILNTLDKFNKADNVKGIIVRINSPGGGVTASEKIYNALKRTKKPVYVAMESVAASGGYYSAVGGDRLFANQSTVTGSIGVIMHTIKYKKLLDKIGIDSNVIKSGAMKDIGSPTRDMTAEEKALLQSVISDMYDQFITAIANNRKKLSKEQVRKIADGRIFTGRQALEASLIDEIRDFHGVVLAMKHKLNLTNEKVTLWEPQKHKKWWAELSAKSILNMAFHSLSSDIIHSDAAKQNSQFLLMMS